MPSLAEQKCRQNLEFFAKLKPSKVEIKLEFNKATGLFSSYSGTGFMRTLGNKFNSNNDRQSVTNDAMFSIPIREIFAAASQNAPLNLRIAALEGLEKVAKSYSGDPIKLSKISNLIRELRDLHVPVPISEISKCNAAWGICGFASSLAALFDKNILTGKAQGCDLQTRILAEIKIYLLMLQADNPMLIKKIEVFTHSFGGNYIEFTVKEFLQKCSEIHDANVLDNFGFGVNNKFGIAMPAEAVIDFFHRYGKKATLTESPNPIGTGVILGLGSGTDMNKRLLHWVYKFDACHVYNNGEIQLLTECLLPPSGSPYSVNYQISID